MDIYMNLNEFLKWEATTRDTIDFKRIYADVADGDVVAGLVLSELVFWYLPNKNGESKLRCHHDGTMWIAARRYEWWDRCRLTPNQSDRAINILVGKGIVEKKVYKFNGEPTVHLRLLEKPFLDAMQDVVSNPKENPYKPKTNSATAENEFGSGRSPLTETTTEVTTPLARPSKENPLKNASLDWAIAANLTSEEVAGFAAREQDQKDRSVLFEQEMGYGALPWWTDAKLKRVLTFLMTKTPEEIKTFAAWSKRDFSSFTPAKARLNPIMIIELWPQAFPVEKRGSELKEHAL